MDWTGIRHGIRLELSDAVEETIVAIAITIIQLEKRKT